MPASVGNSLEQSEPSDGYCNAAVGLLLDPRHSCFGSPASAAVFEGVLLLSAGFEGYLAGVVIDWIVRRVWVVDAGGVRWRGVVDRWDFVDTATNT